MVALLPGVQQADASYPPCPACQGLSFQGFPASHPCPQVLATGPAAAEGIAEAQGAELAVLHEGVLSPWYNTKVGGENV